MIEEHGHSGIGGDAKRINFADLVNFHPYGSAVPTAAPTNPRDAIYVYKNGSDYRLYVYSFDDSAWVYIGSGGSFSGGGTFSIDTGESIDTTSSPLAVYISGGDVYKTDASSISKIAPVGFADYGQNITSPAPITVSKIAGSLVDNFSGLTAGNDYYLANNCTITSPITGGTAGTALSDVLAGDIAGTTYAMAKEVTFTNGAEVISITLNKVANNNSATGNLVCYISPGPGPNAANYGVLGNGEPYASASVAANTIGGAYQSVTWTFSTPVKLGPGTYHFHWYHDTPVLNDYFTTESGNAYSATVFRYSTALTPDWTNTNALDITYSIALTTVSAGAGKITDYCMTYPVYVGTATSASQLMTQLSGKSGRYLRTSTNPTFIANGTYYFQSSPNANKCVLVFNIEAGAGDNRDELTVYRRGTTTATYGSQTSSDISITVTWTSNYVSIACSSATLNSATVNWYE